MSNTETRYEELRSIWRRDPVYFCIHALGMSPTNQQVDLMRAVVDNKFIACKSGHGTGKSTALAALIWWFLICFDDAQVPCTAPSAPQLKDVLWARISELKAGLPPFIGEQWEVIEGRVKHVEKKHSFAVARTTKMNQTDALQGFHADNLLIAVDEACGVAEDVFMPVLGALTSTSGNNKIVLIGNPTRVSGFFYGCFSKDSFWRQLTFNAEKSDLVSGKQINFWRKRYGEDSDQYRVRVKGQFPLSDDSSLFDRGDLELAKTLEYSDDFPIIWGLDVALGGSDNSVLAKRHGHVIKEITKFSYADAMMVTNFVMGNYNQTPMRDRPQAIMVDYMGVGAGVCDRLLEKKYPARRIQAGSSAFENHLYANLRAEMYCRLMREFRERSLKIPDNDELVDELLSISYKYDTKGRYLLKSKQDMRRAGVKSPDSADAVALTFSETLPVDFVAFSEPTNYMNYAVL